MARSKKVKAPSKAQQIKALEAKLAAKTAELAVLKTSLAPLADALFDLFVDRVREEAEFAAEQAVGNLSIGVL